MSDESNISAAGKYLTFRLGEEIYGLPLRAVHEIIGMMPITIVPRMPSFLRGVMNLRGQIIPVLEMRNQFGMVECEETEETCIIVVESPTHDIGVIVDSVLEVLDIKEDSVVSAPSFGMGIDTSFIIGIAKSNGIVILLDIEKVLGDGKLANIKVMRDLTSKSGSGEDNRKDPAL